VLRGGPDQLGMLVGVGGLGILAGALVTEPFCGRFGRGPTLFGAVVVAATGFAALGVARSPLLSVALACLTAAATIVWQVTSAATVQLAVDPRDRGRLLGVYDLFRLALIPVGSVGLGALADVVGVTATCLIAGGATVVGAAATAASNRSLRRLRSMPSPTP
jgi:ENTS family enterobactin (siderophore) exporter